MEGWVKLYRKMLNNAIFSSEKGLKIWIWCLLKARRYNGEVYFGMKKISLKKGKK